MSQSGLVDIEGSHPQIPTAFVADVGSAIPIANTIEILGTNAISTSAAGNTVTVTAATATAGATVGASTIGVSSFDSASFAVTAGFVTLVGGAGVETFLTDDGAPAVVPDVAGEVDILGGNNITTSGQGPANAITLSVTGTTDHTVQIGNATGSLTSLAAATNGQLLIGSNGVDPVLGTLTDGNNITFTEGAGTITANLTGTTQFAVQVGDSTGSLDSLASVGTAAHVLTSNGPGAIPSWQAIPSSGFTWSDIGANQTLVVNTGVNCTTGGALSLALPAVSAVGDVIEVVLDGSTSWEIPFDATQQLRIGSAQTTSGYSGSIASTAQGDWLRFVCKTANTVWTCVGVIGNIDITESAPIIPFYVTKSALNGAALTTDGLAWTWGSGANGALGNETITAQSSPIQVVGNHSFISIATGTNFAITLKANGECWSWGKGTNGQLGDLTKTSKSSPIQVVGNHSFEEIAVGDEQSFGLKADGSAWGWGLNTGGKLGDGSTTTRSSPVTVIGAHNFIQLKSTNFGGAGLKADGSIWTWGDGSQGMLGDGTTTGKSSPVEVVGNHSFIQVMCSTNSTAGLKADGSVWSWGFNVSGNSGDLTLTSKSSPVQMVGNHSFISLGGGLDFMSGLKADGTIWSTGKGYGGALGDQESALKSSPVQVVGYSNFNFVATGNGAKGSGINADNTILGWGINSSGQIGDGTIISKSSPVVIIGI